MSDPWPSERALSIVCCPKCDEPLSVTRAGEPAVVQCANRHQFATERGYLDLSGGQHTDAATDKTFASFGYEWNAFDDVREEDARFADVYFRDLELPALKGSVGLDVGCGKGRYTRFLAPHLDALVALDGSSAVEAAARNLSRFDNVVVVKSDLRYAPIAPNSVDFLSCLGVLHHLEDPRKGFDRLVELLAPGGRILIYVYSRPERRGARSLALDASAAMRKVTVGLPHSTLKMVTTPIAAALYAGVVLPGQLGEKYGVDSLARLPMNSYRGKPFRSLVLDTFDRLSAPVENRYIWSELEPWFSENDLTIDAHRDETGWFVLAHRS
ncbi:MAG TPA: class I SAM-dependent methyltransferase [Acidimicrobiales bacterium]|nr:class I SAM-dependent methyltransferase [Acidimicrobiales bacterium]